MAFNPNAPQDRKNFDDNLELPEANEGYPARCVRIIELGEHEDKYGVKPRIVLGFVVPELTIEVDGKKKQRMFWTYPQNMTSNPDSTIVKYMKALNPEATSADDCLGKPCTITFSHKEKGGKTYANISEVSRVTRGVTVDEPDCDVYYFDFDNPDKEIWDKFSDGRKEQIKSAKNYEGSAVEAMVEGKTYDKEAADDAATDDDIDDVFDDVFDDGFEDDIPF